jgi:hypothetical protein
VGCARGKAGEDGRGSVVVSMSEERLSLIVAAKRGKLGARNRM